jgi:hypothetical protein
VPLPGKEGTPAKKTARRYIRARAALWRQVVQPFAYLKNRRSDSLAQERRRGGIL